MYDIFISYRRDGGRQYARILQLMLAQRGYRVFLDYEELIDGIFSNKIQAAIKEAPVFLLVLSKGALDRCVNEDDAVRAEIELAHRCKKEIIPINPDNEFGEMPDNIPDFVNTVAGKHQRSEVFFGQTLGVTLDFMIETRLVPKIGKRTPLKKVDETSSDAQITLEKQDRHRKFIKRISILGLFTVIFLVAATCGIFLIHSNKKEVHNEKIEQLEKEYRKFGLKLNKDLSMTQMDAISDILSKMIELYPDSVFISQFEFTTGEWYGIKDEKYDIEEKDMPMTGVSFNEISFFLMDLSDMTGISFELPSENEWEYAARSGKYNEDKCYSGENNVEKVAWYTENSGGRLHESNGQNELEGNRLDLFDMCGNAGELCNTPYESNKENVPYTVKGGNYQSTKEEVLISARSPISTEAEDPSVGFRVIIRKSK